MCFVLRVSSLHISPAAARLETSNLISEERRSTYSVCADARLLKSNLLTGAAASSEEGMGMRENMKREGCDLFQAQMMHRGQAHSQKTDCLNWPDTPLEVLVLI